MLYMEHDRRIKNMSNTEKVSVNMNIGTLSQIDLLVDQGYYSDRSDFINQSVREALNLKQERIKAEEEYFDKWNFFWFMGVRVMSRNELEKIKENGHKKTIKGYGMLVIDDSLDDLVIETISSINVKGKVKCSNTLKEYYGITSN